ncbi:MAG: guanylate kinase [Lachnospiraceae bacterium]|nr:guanylate kinase [Lachnospiraceae bacterium]
MATIYVLMGKSASGKDTIYRRLLGHPELDLCPVVLYTTRPVRSGEEDGRDYHFVDEVRLRELEAQGKVIEHRVYQTVHGAWHYFTVDDGQISLCGKRDYLMIDTLEGYLQLRKYFGAEHVAALYVEVEDGLRLSRALERERGQQHPRYAELCRRFLADEEDFSPEKLSEAGVLIRYSNEDLENCIQAIAAAVRA